MERDRLIVGCDEESAPYQIRRKHSKCRISSLAVALIVLSVIVVLVTFIIIVILAYQAKNTSQQQSICAKPPVLLVSLDGFRFDYLQRGKTPNIQQFANDGVQAEYMTPVFPSLTFPNHYTIVTGLYPESHGIVANAFYSTSFGEMFYTSSPNATQSKWWEGEPVWITASNNNMKTAVYFWPGSEVEGLQPDIYFKYDSSVPFSKRVDTVLSWFDLPEETRPQFMALYFNEPDHTAHEYGPNTTQVDQALVEVDNAIAQLVEGLKKKDIYDCVNVIIVSDHGMTTLEQNQVYTLVPQILPEEYYSELVIAIYGIFAQLYVKNSSDIQDIYNIVKNNVTNLDAKLDVYLRDDVPEEFHVGHYNQDRYGDVIVISQLHGYLKLNNGQPSKISIGEHGYDNQQPLMRALFLSHGPAFKSNYHSGPVQNIDIYELMCNNLNITSSPNNGSLSRISDILKS